MTRNFSFIILFLLIPMIVSANAGSPLLWFGSLHLIVLNALFGWGESVIIKKFKIPNRTWLIIAGNYVSMLIGLYFIAPHFPAITGNHDLWDNQTLQGGYQAQDFMTGIISSFLVTIVMEIPFAYLAVKEKQQRKKIFIPFLVANLITNTVVTTIYFWINGNILHW